MSESWKDSRFQCEQLPTCYVKETGSCHFHSYWFLVKPHTVASSVYKLNDETIAGQESDSTTCWLALLPLHSTNTNFIKNFCLFLQFWFTSLKYSYNKSRRMCPLVNIWDGFTVSFVERNFVITLSWSNQLLRLQARQLKSIRYQFFSCYILVNPTLSLAFFTNFPEPTVYLISDLFVLCFSRRLTLLT